MTNSIHMTQEKWPSLETPKHDTADRGKQQKPFDPIEQRLSWSADLVSREYKEKLWKDLPEETKQLLVKVLIWKSQEDRDNIFDNILDTIADGGTDVDSDIIEYLESINFTQTENTNEEVENTIEVNKIILNQEKTTRLKNFDELANSLAGVNLDWKDSVTIDILTRIRNLQTLLGKEWWEIEFDTEVSSILNDLKKSPETLQAVAIDLQAQSPKAYETFRTSLISLDSDFITLLPTQDAKAKLTLWNDNLREVTITNGKISQNSSDGYTTTANLDGTERTLSRMGSNYKMKSTLSNDEVVQKEADNIASEANKELEPINSILENLHAIKKYLESVNLPNADISEIKENIKTYSPEIYSQLWIDNINSVNDIHIRIDEYIAKISIQRDEIEEKAKNSLNELVQNHKMQLEQEEIIYKQYLTLYNQAWIDIFSNQEIAKMFQNANKNPWKYWLQKPIDLDNCSIWFDIDFWDRDISTLERGKFFETCNRLYTGNPNYPIWYEGGNIVYYSSEEHAINKTIAPVTFNLQEFIRRNLWVTPVNTASRNLETSISEHWIIGNKEKQVSDTKLSN